MTWIISIVLGVIALGIAMLCIAFLVWVDSEFNIPIMSILITIGIIAILSVILHAIIF